MALAFYKSLLSSCKQKSLQLGLYLMCTEQDIDLLDIDMDLLGSSYPSIMTPLSGHVSTEKLFDKQCKRLQNIHANIYVNVASPSRTPALFHKFSSSTSL